MLRHQLNVLQRKAPKRPVFGNFDRPQREPERRTRGLDTMLVEPPTDWSLVIRQALLGERSFLTEAFGEALGEYGNDVIAEVETMITAAVDKLRAEMRDEASRQLEHLRTKITAQTTELFESIALIHSQGDQLRARLEEIVAKKARTTKRNLLQLPAPNGNGDARGQH